VAQERKIRMLASQRALFDIPRDVCYLNAASYSPLPLQTLEAGRAAVARKGRPWLIDNEFAAQQYDRARKAAAALINAASDNVALISSVGYGVSTAAKVIAVPTGSRVLVLQDDHSSAVLEWITRAGEGGFTVETIRRPQDGDWTAAWSSADRKCFDLFSALVRRRYGRSWPRGAGAARAGRRIAGGRHP
jgi:selenocysteine lyase/cysteine desulfurase